MQSRKQEVSHGTIATEIDPLVNGLRTHARWQTEQRAAADLAAREMTTTHAKPHLGNCLIVMQRSCCMESRGKGRVPLGLRLCSDLLRSQIAHCNHHPNQTSLSRASFRSSLHPSHHARIWVHSLDQHNLLLHSRHRSRHHWMGNAKRAQFFLD